MKNRNELLIFDLDDTLVDTSDVYWKVRQEFANYIHGSSTLEKDKIVEKFEEIDTLNMNKYGIHPKRYGITMMDTYNYLYNEGYIKKNISHERIESIGKILFHNIPQLINGAIEVLRWCSQYFKVTLLTRGIEEIQMLKINETGIVKYFDNIKVVPYKDSNVFTNFINEMNYQKEKAWIIGDSLKSDINPAIEIGVKSILYLYTHHTYKWLQEYNELSKGKFYLAKNLTDIIEILKNPTKHQLVDSYV